jgi:hypothetical protein
LNATSTHHRCGCHHAGGNDFSIPEGLYSSEVLKTNPLPDGVDAGTKEQWLSDEEFMHIFGMAKESFKGLPKWKQSNAKKKHGLF